MLCEINGVEMEIHIFVADAACLVNSRELI